jgi:hypothetical protein
MIENNGFTTLVRLVGIAVIDVIILYAGYQFYDKNRIISLASLLLAIIITLACVLSTLYFRNVAQRGQAK